jgi:hypothetical protein
LCVAYLGFYLFRVGHYCMSRCLVDNLEPTSICIAWLWGQGNAMYHGPASAERYSVLYGPGMFLSEWLALRAFGATVAVAKITGACLSVAAVAFVFWTLKRLASPLLAFVGTSYCLMVFLRRPFWNTTFGVRAEPQLLFWVSAGLFSAVAVNPVIAALGCGVAAGILVNIKIHAGLYALPAFGLLYQRHGVRPVMGAAVLASIVAACPFIVFKEISLANYLAWLKLASRHGLSMVEFKLVVAELLFILLPIVAAFGYLALRDGQRFLIFLRSNWPLFLSLALGIVLVLVPASKAGAGAHHLMAFIPTLALVMCIALAQPTTDGEMHGWKLRAVRSAGAVFAVVALATTLPRQWDQMHEERFRDVRSRAILGEIAAIEKRFPGEGVAMGYGGDGTYFDTNVRADLVLAGNPYLIDAFALMEMNAGGLPIPDATRQAIRNGTIDLWLIPAGDEPFSLHTLYPSRAALFDPAFRLDFLSHYSIAHRTVHLDVWRFIGKTKSASRARDG